MPWIRIRTTLKLTRLRHSGPQPYGVILTNKFKLWTHAKTIFSFALARWETSSTKRHCVIYIFTKGGLQNEQLPDGPKAHLARWPQTNGQITSVKQLPYGQTSQELQCTGKQNQTNEHNQKNYREQARPGAVYTYLLPKLKQPRPSHRTGYKPGGNQGPFGYA